MDWNALLEFFEPVKDHLNLRSSRCSGLVLIGIDGPDKTAIARDV